MLAQPACTPQRTLNMESQQGLVRFYHVKVVICFMNALHNIRIRVLDGFEGFRLGISGAGMRMHGLHLVS